MSRRLSATDERVRELEAEVERWRTAYRELAMAIARRDGYGTPVTGQALGAGPPGKLLGGGTFSAEPALPGAVLAAIEDTTAPFSDARTTAIDAARALLESGAQPEEVEAELRRGEEIKV